MKLFRVKYKGLWLGGCALVIANDEADAVIKVKNDSRTYAFEDVTAVEIPLKDVIYNSNGDY